MAAQGKQNEYILDQLICYMSNPLFQIPVLSFMEAKCLIFDPSTEDSPSYREVHEEYKKLIDILLEGFRTDTGLTHDQIIRAMKDLSAKSEVAEFQMLFEQILATSDFPIFVRIMAQKNLELQQQALMMIAQVMGGDLPPSLLKDTQTSQQTQPHASPNEDQILLAVLAKSKEEYEHQQAKSKREDDELHIIIGMSKMENARIEQSMQQEQEKLNETLRTSLSLGERPVPVIKTPSASKPTVSKSSGVPPPAQYQPKTKSSTSTIKPAPLKQETSAQAAAAWLKSAESEVGASSAHSKAVHAAAASMAGMSEEEYKKRAEFLRQQRDKLMDMKKKEREKQLLSVEKSQPQRPASARAARAAMKQNLGEGPSPGQEDEKKLAMRRAIADRLKSELLGKK